MANKDNLDYTYSTIDTIFRLSIGEMGDFSGAKYDGDFSKTLEEAQRSKHTYIAQQLHINKDSRVIDLGCGWGPFLHYASHEVGARCIGLTLSQAQRDSCEKNGLQVYLQDCRTIRKEDFGSFTAAVSIGAFEHFCSVEEFMAGKQEKIYSDFFEHVASILPSGAKFYLQTMTFGQHALPYSAFDITADKRSDAYILALMEKQFPGSWLPSGLDMLTSCAKPFFKLKQVSNGRLDYIETISQWRRKFRNFTIKKYGLYACLAPRYLWDREFRHRVNIFRLNPNKICFERELMDHFRLTLERV